MITSICLQMLSGVTTQNVKIEPKVRALQITAGAQTSPEVK